MTIVQYMTETGFLFWRSTGVSLIIAFSEWAVLLLFARTCGPDRFFARRGLFLHAGAFAAQICLQLCHFPVHFHCISLLLFSAVYICLLTGCSSFNGTYESSIYVLVLEMGKALCRDGLLAYGLFRLFPGIGERTLNFAMLGLYLAYLSLVCLSFARRKAPLIYLPLSLLKTLGLLFPLMLYLMVRLFQYGEVRTLDNLGWLKYDLLQYGIAVCALIVMGTYRSMLSSQLAANELLRQQMLNEQKQQYIELQRESIENMNRRYHDLRHYLTGMEAALSQAGESGGEGLLEAGKLLHSIREEIEPYSSICHTGSSVMDVLLEERIRECREKKIRLLTFVDGSGTAKLSTLDLSVLFGNAMDNAIEAAEEVEEESLREISVKIGVSDGFLLMRFQNFFKKDRRLSGKKFLSTKEDPRLHGFGLGNIARTAEKYGGSISTECRENTFVLVILIPIAESENEKQ